MNDVLIVGASTRAAAFSAKRAGLGPVCVDLFADRDLVAACPVLPLSGGEYPAAIAELAKAAPTCPWLYAGGIENHPSVVQQLCRDRVLWGNEEQALGRVRDPHWIQRILHKEDLPCLHVIDALPAGREPQGWLLKPLRGAGGAGIRWANSAQAGIRNYFQEFKEGDPYSALFVADGRRAHILGVTRQLIGEPWLHVTGFRYCGSVGPIELPETTKAVLGQMGKALASAAGMMGLFGIDFILADHVPWLVEVNPRYTASVEVLEHATGLKAMRLHQDACTGRPIDAKPAARSCMVGKGILYAERKIIFPEAGPWLPLPGWSRLPKYADIPQGEEIILQGKPILSFFVEVSRSSSQQNDFEECLRQLKLGARDLDRRLGNE